MEKIWTWLCERLKDGVLRVVEAIPAKGRQSGNRREKKATIEEPAFWLELAVLVVVLLIVGVMATGVVRGLG